MWLVKENLTDLEDWNWYIKYGCADYHFSLEKREDNRDHPHWFLWIVRGDYLSIAYYWEKATKQSWEISIKLKGQRQKYIVNQIEKALHDSWHFVSTKY